MPQTTMATRFPLLAQYNRYIEQTKDQSCADFRACVYSYDNISWIISRAIWLLFRKAGTRGPSFHSLDKWWKTSPHFLMQNTAYHVCWVCFRISSHAFVGVLFFLRERKMGTESSSFTAVAVGPHVRDGNAMVATTWCSWCCLYSGDVSRDGINGSLWMMKINPMYTWILISKFFQY